MIMEMLLEATPLILTLMSLLPDVPERVMDSWNAAVARLVPVPQTPELKLQSLLAGSTSVADVDAALTEVVMNSTDSFDNV
jgi:hypothetical protein